MAELELVRPGYRDNPYVLPHAWHSGQSILQYANLSHDAIRRVKAVLPPENGESQIHMGARFDCVDAALFVLDIEQDNPDYPTLHKNFSIFCLTRNGFEYSACPAAKSDTLVVLNKRGRRPQFLHMAVYLGRYDGAEYVFHKKGLLLPEITTLQKAVAHYSLIVHPEKVACTYWCRPRQRLA